MVPALDRRLYDKPPLLEAVIEFQFHPNPKWDSIFLGQLRDRFPEFPHLDTIREGEFVVGPERVGFQHSSEGKRFWRHDRGVAVTVLPKVLAVSTIPPQMAEQHRWETLRDIAMQSLEHYRSVVGAVPIRQIGVRYINGVPITPADFRLSEWVNMESGLVPERLKEEKNPFSVRVERVIEVTKPFQRREVLGLGTQHVPEHGWRLMLDIDEIVVWKQSPATDHLSPVLERLHDAVHEVFVQVFRSEILDSFGPLESSLLEPDT